MGRGGRRLGAGRKPYTRRERWLGGNAGKRPLVLVSAAREPVTPVSMTPVEGVTTVTGPHDDVTYPAVLLEGERAYWDLWAPLGLANGTLHDGTVPGFVLLCQWARKAEVFWQCVEERGLEQEKVTIDGAGQEHREYRANGLLARWSDAMKRVEQLQARYGIAADGKVPTGQGHEDTEGQELARALAIK